MKKINLIYLIITLCTILGLLFSCTPTPNDKFECLKKKGYNVNVIYLETNDNEYLPVIKLEVSKINDFGIKNYAYAELYDNKSASELRFNSLSYDNLPYSSLFNDSLYGMDGKWVAWGERDIVLDIIAAK